MKKHLFSIIILFATALSNGQFINFPDNGLKQKLLNYEPIIDTNNDSEIQFSEALVVTELDLGIGIQNVSGLEYFTNLTDLKLASSVPNFSLTPFPNLESFELLGGYIYNGVVNFSVCPNLNRIYIHGTSITGVDLTGLNNLTELRLENNVIESIDLTGLSNLSILNLSFNRLFNLNVNGLTNLTMLDCSSNNLTTLDLSNLTNLLSVDCSHNMHNFPGDDIGITNILFSGSNAITTLTCSFNTLNSLNISNLTNLTYLDCYRATLTNLSINNQTNLTFLDCSFNSLTTINLSNNNLLTELYCNNNQINNLSVSNLSNLTKFDCSYNQIPSLDITFLNSITELNCESNQITNLNFIPLTQLFKLIISNNPLTSIDVSTLLNLEELRCFDCNLNSIDVTSLTSLKILSCGKNSLTSIDISNQTLLNYLECSQTLVSEIDLSHVNPPIPTTSAISTYLNASYNPNLSYINFKNGLDYTSSMLSIAAGNSPNLTYICANEQNIIPFKNSLLMNSGGPMGIININAIQFNSYCTFVPGGMYNTISGNLTIDTNNNGCDSSDYKTQNIKVAINDGSQNGATFTNDNGDYSFYTQAGNFTITPVFENPYFTITPANASLNFSSVNGSTQTQNFCIIPNGVHNDLEITIYPANNPRPGYSAAYYLTYKNKGNQAISGTIGFTFNDDVLDYAYSNPTIVSQSLNNLSWNYSNLLPFESRTIYFYLNVNAPTATPPVNIGDILNSSVSISPISGDETPDDNTLNLQQTVVGSFDPNDKTCLEGDTIPPTKVGDYLHYLIRFQNSGTAPAENVVVKDMIDTAKFDLASLQLTATSHQQVTRITGNKVEFIFENIQLPAEQDDEPGSHGYIAFKIRTKNNLVLGNTVSNTANIYFDYNFPIITNTTNTTVTALGNNEFENASVSITPNPVKNNLTISAADVISSVQMYDVQGRLIATQLNNTTSTTLDMSQQNTGAYFVKVITENGVKVEKIIKE